jgi:hypothetical protein
MIDPSKTGLELPERIKIGGHWWTIHFPYKFQERNEKGLCDWERKIIYVADTDLCGHLMAKSTIWVTFLHELGHAIDYTTGHRIWNNNGQDQEENEKSLEGFSECVFQVIADNGGFFLPPPEIRGATA